MNAFSLESITACRHSGGEFSSDADQSPYNVSLLRNEVSHRQFTQELRLSGEIGNQAEWTVGGYYYDARDTDFNRIHLNFGIQPGGGGIPGVLPPLDFVSDEDVIKSDNKSAFAPLVLHPAAGFRVTRGLRYSDESKSYSLRAELLMAPPIRAWRHSMACYAATPAIGSIIGSRSTGR